ncbi:Plastocyanin [Streptomyces sp. TLI_053]|uniref:cupredoxin domain-containing protein n=1 Tax=Streptomyces sp. TLI_053 TaxID=1855352 RepID=UPI00087D3F0A|nr:cupredoxin domain-containing protein [Streptomyces sp. TLI_053]SDT78557.1 Plastocyanin [Streptomyces sp. TLI_053]
MTRRSFCSFRASRASRTALAAVMSAWLLVGAAGCSSSSGGGSSSPAASSPAASSAASSSASSAPAGAAAVTIKDFTFGPATLTVAPGTSITVTNQDSAGHTLTAIAPNAGAFDTGLLEQGRSATITAPTTPGSYPFHCDVHPNMTGTLVVQ